MGYLVFRRIAGGLHVSGGSRLGLLVQGIEIENRAYAGGWWDWLTPFFRA